MKKISRILLLSIIAISAIWIGATYPKIGHITFDNATDLEASLFGFEQKEANIGEMKLSYYESERSANKPTIVLLHGYSADKDVWPRFARHLVDDYHIIIPDFAGHGDTEFNQDWNYSAPKQAERLLALINTLDIQHVHLAGNSMGGFIAAHFAKDYPQRTLSALLIDPAGVHSAEPSDMGKMLAAGRNPFEIENNEEFAEFYSMTMANPPWVPGFVLAAISEDYQQRQSQLTQIFDDFHEKDMLDSQLHEIQVPVLLLWGQEDRLIHVSSVEVWKAGIPNIQVEVWEGIGHMPMVEAPVKTATLYKSFLENALEK
ncbi:MAG: abhydrolase domain-containing protein 6 [Oleispira sp.]|jgi:abhydrolase domain-containing protein 6